ncbi:SAM-dependent methyltransferase [Sciscionella sediminilitoris]|uniref:SAM-dependent methyltransferase n=1 Tax=Sciscionella sediminilitoris TaxID=1445613 RepID=UPI00056C3296|nr:cyclopropane-fatty-acyl-phospholipid synthase family protein [Sciscionella sp. SE31]
MATIAGRLANLFEELLGAPLPVGLRAWDGSTAGPGEDPVAVLRSPTALRHLLWAPGELGLARAYVTGELDVAGDLTEGLRRCWPLTTVDRGRALRPHRVLAAAGSIARLGALGPRPRPPREEARPHGKPHSRNRDRAVIAHHYDRGNDFYELVLDPSMAYSCGLWRGERDTLEQAQRAKLDLVCRELELAPGARLLDVGCGWGSLVLHAAREYGVHSLGITLAEQQARFIRDRARREGLDRLVEVRTLDYRDLDRRGEFDAVASIEMGEHVGERHYPDFASALSGSLRPGARLWLQQMSHGTRAPGGGAFIESYIAPDMTMRPLPATLAHLEVAGLEIRAVLALREHYVRTIGAWSELFERRYTEVAALTGERYARVWRLYLAGAALAFETGRMGVDRILATRRS